MDNIYNRMGILCSHSWCYSLPAIPCCGYDPKVKLPYDAGKTAHWFELIARSNGLLPLTRLVAISSHDAGTYSIPDWKCCSGISKNHNVDLYEQMKAGARHIDLRVGSSDSGKAQGVLIQHGIHTGGLFSKEVMKIRDFLIDFPNEFVMVDIKCEAVLSPNELIFVVQFMHTNFGGLMINSKDVAEWFRIDSVTIGQILKKEKKRVYLTVDKHFFKAEIPGKHSETEAWMKSHNAFSRETSFKRYYPRNPSPYQVLKGCEEFLRAFQTTSKLSVTELILTPKFNCCELMKYSTGLARVRVDQKTYEWHRNRFLHTGIRDAISVHSNLNLVMLDFFSFDSNIGNFLMGLNCSDQIIVHRCEASKANDPFSCKDVTREARGLVRRENSLWILDFKRDLNLNWSRGKVMIVFSVVRREEEEKNGQGGNEELLDFSDEEPKRMNLFSFSENTQYLLNPLIHLTNGSVLHKENASSPINPSPLISPLSEMKKIQPADLRPNKNQHKLNDKGLLLEESQKHE